MNANDSKRYYWLKMFTNFFDNHKLRSLSMYEHGREAQLLYVKLLVESIPHNGELRNTQNSPYTDMMIAGFTFTPVEIVTQSISLLESVDLIKRLSDGTIKFLEMGEFIGSETGQSIRKKASALNRKSECNSDEQRKPSPLSSANKTNDNNQTRTSKAKPYPSNFKQIMDFLKSSNTAIIDESYLLAKFMELNKSGWKDNGGQAITDWQKYFITIANKCNANSL